MKSRGRHVLTGSSSDPMPIGSFAQKEPLTGVPTLTTHDVTRLRKHKVSTCINTHISLNLHHTEEKKTSSYALYSP